MDREKEMLKLTKQAVKMLEKQADSSTSVQLLEATNVGWVMVISGHDPTAFSQSVYDKALEMEERGAVKVEVQYSTACHNSPAGLMVMYSALLIGRKHANTSAK